VNEFLIYIAIGIIVQFALINRSLMRNGYYEIQILDLILFVSVVILWPIILLLILMKTEFSKVIFTLVRKMEDSDNEIR
jgi:hypothetical protein